MQRKLLLDLHKFNLCSLLSINVDSVCAATYYAAYIDSYTYE